MSPNESESPPPPLWISSLGVNVDRQSHKEVQSITLKAGRVSKQIRQEISPGRGYEERFDPPLEVAFNEKLSVTASVRNSFRVVTFNADPQEVHSGANEECGRQLYRKTARNIEFIVGLHSLPSTVNEIVPPYTKFRVLTIGQSGVGKSSLINTIFGVHGVDVSHDTRGRASIDEEHIASENQRFIVHDSRGFESADHECFTAACDFISSRRGMQDLKDRLHAVWLCLSIPFAGGRLLETGIEDFLRDRKRILGNVPLVVVFTKLDLLANHLAVEALGRGEEVDDATQNRRLSDSLEKLCFKRLREAAGGENLSCVAVSTSEGHEDTLSKLVDVTTKDIQKYVKDEAAHHIATIAQRVNITLKVALTISVGEKRYWKALWASPNFQNHTIKECLGVIHKDIITIWNFNDPDNSLSRDDFKDRLLSTQTLEVRKGEDTWTTAKANVSVVSALVTIIGAVAGSAGTALPIIVPIAGVVVLGKLAHDLYRASQDIVRKFMAYIVDLTCVMQIIFLLASTRHGVVDSEVVEIAMQAYERAHKNSVHCDINNFKVNLAVAPGKRDHVLDRLKELINKYKTGDEELTELRRRLQQQTSKVA